MNFEIGTDIIEIKRIIEKFKDNPSLEKLIFTNTEINQVKEKTIKYQTLAGKWAAKEAFSKALGTGIGKELHWQDMEISNDITGKPIIEVSQNIMNKFHITHISLSISHTTQYATATILLLKQ